MKRDLSQDLLLSVLSHLNLHDIVSVICSCKTFDSTDYLRMKHDAMKDIAIKALSMLRPRNYRMHIYENYADLVPITPIEHNTYVHRIQNIQVNGKWETTRSRYGQRSATSRRSTVLRPKVLQLHNLHVPHGELKVFMHVTRLKGIDPGVVQACRLCPALATWIMCHDASSIGRRRCRYEFVEDRKKIRCDNRARYFPDVIVKIRCDTYAGTFRASGLLMLPRYLHNAVAKGSQITVDNAYLYWTHVSVHWN